MFYGVNLGYCKPSWLYAYNVQSTLNCDYRECQVLMEQFTINCPVIDFVNTVDREYFGVTKVTWVKCSMSFNFINFAGIRNILLRKFFHVMCMCIVIEMAAYEMESSIHDYHVYKDLWDALIGEDILMMKIDMLWLYSKMTPLSVIFHERNHKSILCFSKGWCCNLYAHRRKEIFFTPAAKYIHYNFWYKM